MCYRRVGEGACMLKMWEREALGLRRKRTLLGFEADDFCGRKKKPKISFETPFTICLHLGKNRPL